MANVKALQEKLLNMAQTTGKAALSALFPNDFEFYMCALELATAEGNTIDYFTFPVTPSSISKTDNKRTSVYNTAGGIVALTSPTFVPQEISIRGTFGRIFKILIDIAPTGAGVAFSLSSGIRTLGQLTKKATVLQTPSFDASVKTGYGALKIMQSIISKSNGVDDKGQPFRLYFYNPALGESYLVMIPPNGFTCSQNEQRNMVWDYTLNMIAVAPLEEVKNTSASSSLTQRLASAVIQKTVNDLASFVAARI
jgi:hypothetical protein